MDELANPLAYFLDFVDPESVRRIAYAASFGMSEWQYHEQTAEAASLLGEFHAVSVREQSGRTICREQLGRSDATVVLDPTLLVDHSFYDQVAPVQAGDKTRSLFVYVLDRGKPVREATNAALNYLGDDGLTIREVSPDDTTVATDVPSWIRAFRESEYVLTDSFHGTVMAIIFQKPFVVVPNRERGLDRFTSLLDAVGLSDRILTTADEAEVAKVIDSPIDYGDVAKRLDRLRAESSDFLLSALG
jgi:hypothetical protein